MWILIVVLVLAWPAWCALRALQDMNGGTVDPHERRRLDAERDIKRMGWGVFLMAEMEAQAKRDNDVRAGRIAPEPPPKVVHNPYGYPPIGPRE